MLIRLSHVHNDDIKNIVFCQCLKPRYTSRYRPLMNIELFCPVTNKLSSRHEIEPLHVRFSSNSTIKDDIRHQ
jgi:hypothetical protein